MFRDQYCDSCAIRTWDMRYTDNNIAFWPKQAGNGKDKGRLNLHSLSQVFSLLTFKFSWKAYLGIWIYCLTQTLRGFKEGIWCFKSLSTYIWGIKFCADHGWHWQFLVAEWRYLPENNLIRFPDPQNICLYTNIVILWSLEPELWSKSMKI